MNPLTALQTRKGMTNNQFAKWLGVPMNTLRNWKCDPSEKNYRPIPDVVVRYIGLIEMMDVVVPGVTDEYVRSLINDQ